MAGVEDRALHEQGSERALTMALRGLEYGAVENGYQSIVIHTDRGPIGCRYYVADGAHVGVIFVGGGAGDFDSPARQLYPRLCEMLRQEGMTALRIRFRHSTILEEAVLDVLAGMAFLESEGVRRLALVGHSFGGAVVIQAAAASGTVVATVITLATQSYGADAVERLSPGCSILLLHGEDDDILPPICSESIHDLAPKPRELRLYRGAGHGLDEVADEVYCVVRAWIQEHLKGEEP